MLPDAREPTCSAGADQIDGPARARFGARLRTWRQSAGSAPRAAIAVRSWDGLGRDGIAAAAKTRRSVQGGMRRNRLNHGLQPTSLPTVRRPMAKKRKVDATVEQTPSADSKTAKRSRTKRSGGEAKGAAWTFPKETLESAIRVARAIDEKHGGNPMNAADLAKAVGFRQSADWRFLDLLRAANQYGLVSGSGKAATVRLEKLGQDIVVPGDASDRQRALLEAFRNVEDFKKVEEFYGSKRLPEDEFFKTRCRDSLASRAIGWIDSPTCSGRIWCSLLPSRQDRARRLPPSRKQPTPQAGK